MCYGGVWRRDQFDEMEEYSIFSNKEEFLNLEEDLPKTYGD